MRRLIERGLERQKSTAVSFTDGEKLLFMTLRDMCKQLNLKKGETDLDLMASVIYGGHYWAPRWAMTGRLPRWSAVTSRAGGRPGWHCRAHPAGS